MRTGSLDVDDFPLWRAALQDAARAWLRRLSLDAPLESALFWSSAAVYALSFLLVRFPPCVDYPQHLALAAILSRSFDPGAAEHALYAGALLSYNGLFHVAVALLAELLPIEWAGKVVLALVPLLIAAAALSGMRYARRPLWLASLFLPMSYGFAMGWGFVNYCLAVPLALLALVAWLRHVANEPGQLRWVVILSLLVAYAHVLTLVALVLSAAVAFVTRSAPAEIGHETWLRGLARGALAFVPASCYAVLASSSHVQSPHLGWEPERDGLDVAAWTKLTSMVRLSVGNLSDLSDCWLFAGSIAIVVALGLASYVRGREGHGAPREFRALLLVWVLLYFLLPQTLLSTGFIFERIPIWIWFFALTVVPGPRTAIARTIRPLALILPLAAALNTARAFASVPGAGAADAILDRIPGGARLLELGYEPNARPVIERPLWIHHAAYHLVRHRGEIAFDFTRYASLPIRRHARNARPELPSGVEWYPAGYRPDEPYARYYDTLLVVGESGPDRLHELGLELDLIAEEPPFRLYRRRAVPGALPDPSGQSK